jgi:hypothetical protein
VKDVQISPQLFRWPKCPAYWSLDPLGDVRLTSEEADNLGFPSITLTTTIPGYFYDASVYAGLRRFHESKGFDPDSQDVARHLGLHSLSCLVNSHPVRLTMVNWTFPVLERSTNQFTAV